MGNCNSCGGVRELLVPCPSSGTRTRCGCGNCSFSSCSCGGGGGGCGCNTSSCQSPASPTPYYATPAACAENHNKTTVIQEFSGSLRVSNSWNIPACGSSSIAFVDGLQELVIGSYFWNPAYGYFKVIAFNPTNSSVTLQNDCTDGNLPVGTQVPACTDFAITDGPSSSSGGGNNPSLFPYLAVDFTAPNNSTCILITLTNVNGLAVGKNVQIGSGTYELQSISDSTHVTICNTGSGITPGTSVIAKNAQNVFQYPIILIDTNPCTNTAVTSGKLIVCKDNIAQPLSGAASGSVPVLQDPVTGVVRFEILDVPTRTCTAIGCCLILTPGVAAYTILVGDSSIFTVGDILQIGTRTDRFTVTSIPDATHIIGTLDPVPSTLTTIDPGTSICGVECCELLQEQIDQIGCQLNSVPQVTLQAIPITAFSQSITISGSKDEHQLTPTLISVTLPTNCLDHLYLVKATVALQINTVQDDGVVLYELEAVWRPINPSYRLGGRLIWQTFEPSEGYDVTSNAYPTSADEAVYSLPSLQETTYYTMMYHGGQVVAFQYGVAPGATIDLALNLNVSVGDNNYPAILGPVKVIASGFVEIMRLPA